MMLAILPIVNVSICVTITGTLSLATHRCTLQLGLVDRSVVRSLVALLELVQRTLTHTALLGELVIVGVTPAQQVSLLGLAVLPAVELLTDTTGLTTALAADLHLRVQLVILLVV